MKTLGIIGVVVCALGLLGSVTGSLEDAFWGVLVYGYFLALSIMATRS